MVFTDVSILYRVYCCSVVADDGKFSNAGRTAGGRFGPRTEFFAYFYGNAEKRPQRKRDASSPVGSSDTGPGHASKNAVFSVDSAHESSKNGFDETRRCTMSVGPLRFGVAGVDRPVCSIPLGGV